MKLTFVVALLFLKNSWNISKLIVCIRSLDPTKVTYFEFYELQRDENYSLVTDENDGFILYT